MFGSAKSDEVDIIMKEKPVITNQAESFFGIHGETVHIRLYIHTQIDRQIDIQIDRKRDRQIDIQIDRQID